MVLVDESLRAQAWSDAEATLAKFEIDVLLDHRESHRRYRHFRCWQNGSNFYAFSVMAFGQCLVVDGDMGEWFWRREYPMLPWAKRSWHSHQYWNQKLVACRPGDRKEFWPEACDGWFRERWAEVEQEGADGDAVIELEELEASWKLVKEDLPCRHEFYRLLWDSKYWHCDGEVPTVERYAYRFHWIQRALGWLTEKIDDE